MVIFFCAATLQASQTPSSSSLMVVLVLALVCWYSTAELGRWLEITQREQNFTSRGRPYFTSRFVSELMGPPAGTERTGSRAAWPAPPRRSSRGGIGSR